MDGKAALRDVSIHTSEPGTIFDPHGEKVEVKRGLMARLDAKTAEDITLKKGTLALIVAGFVLLQVIFNYGGSFIGWARDDQSQKEQMTVMKSQVDEARKDMKELKDKFDEIQKSLQSQAVKDAEKRGYELGAIDGKTGHANVK